MHRYVNNANITEASAAAVRAMIANLHSQAPKKTGPLQTMDVLEMALPPAEFMAMAGAASDDAPPLDWHGEGLSCCHATSTHKLFRSCLYVPRCAGAGGVGKD